MAMSVIITAIRLAPREHGGSRAGEAKERKKFRQFHNRNIALNLRSGRQPFRQFSRKSENRLDLRELLTFGRGYLRNCYAKLFIGHHSAATNRVPTRFLSKHTTTYAGNCDFRANPEL